MNTEISWHRHHVVPKHAGGTDDPSNLLKCNIAMHSFLHKLRYKETGDKFDLYAYQLLSKSDTAENLRKKAATEGQRRWYADNPEMRKTQAVLGGKATYARHPEHWARVSKLGVEAGTKSWQVTYPDGTVSILKGLKELCKTYKLSQGNLSSRGHSKGFKVKEV